MSLTTLKSKRCILSFNLQHHEAGWNKINAHFIVFKLSLPVLKERIEIESSAELPSPPIDGVEDRGRFSPRQIVRCFYSSFVSLFRPVHLIGLMQYL